jgi:hypothetical protein
VSLRLRNPSLHSGIILGAQDPHCRLSTMKKMRMPKLVFRSILRQPSANLPNHRCRQRLIRISSTIPLVIPSLELLEKFFSRNLLTYSIPFFEPYNARPPLPSLNNQWLREAVVEASLNRPPVLKAVRTFDSAAMTRRMTLFPGITPRIRIVTELGDHWFPVIHLRTRGAAASCKQRLTQRPLNQHT